ncbi:unnamed protein product [Ceutorhynchus assimilis]|uniref:Uncharacterized protein n=1 Tax=Ceutorhynchus assimilis TaxID=467358 RepID=A0A9N9MMQ1_9CUCU|nr:unnamed protein product [Ceutorhynchus assimilis]
MNFSAIFQVALLVISMVLSALAMPQYFEADDLSAEPSEIRDKREHGHGITGPVHTFVKTDKHANFKWGVRHHVGHHYAGRK